MKTERIETDPLIVCSGFAGLWAAISAREAGVERVAVLDKASIAMSSQSRLCAGATIYCLPEDDSDLWLRDIGRAPAQEPNPGLVTRFGSGIDKNSNRARIWSCLLRSSYFRPELWSWE